MAGGQSTDWGGIAIAVAALGGLYLAYTSGIFQRLAAGIQTTPSVAPGVNPVTGQPYGYCSDGSTPNPATGLCANGSAPTTVPIPTVNPLTGQPYTSTAGGTCTGQDMYTGQPCGCYPPTTSSAMMMYGQMSQQYQPSTPTCNCQMCGQAGGYGSTSPYGTSPYGTSPYGTSPYGASPYGTSPYGASPYGTSPYGTSPYGSSPYGVGGIGTGLYPPGYPSYPYGPIGANYSPYPAYPSSPISLGGYPVGGIGVSPIAASPLISPIFGGGTPIFASTGGGGGFGGRGGRGGFQGTSDLNAYAGASIARDAYGF